MEKGIIYSANDTYLHHNCPKQALVTGGGPQTTFAPKARLLWRAAQHVRQTSMTVKMKIVTLRLLEPKSRYRRSLSLSRRVAKTLEA